MTLALANIDSALREMRRLWTPTTSGRTRESADARVDLSTVLVVTAIGAEREGRSVAEIADELGVAATTASRLCDRAVVGGYVIKAPSHADARRLSLSLTESGDALRTRSERFRLAYLARILRDWTAADIDSFEQLLSRFASAVQAHPPTSIPPA